MKSCLKAALLRMADLLWTPESLDPDYASYLRTVADQVVLDNRFGPRLFPAG
jgi:hypothetical protein